MKKSFKFDGKQVDYTIKLKRNSRWWWLLLLLLPLLLLIRFEKTLIVKTVDANSKQPIAAAEVELNYSKYFAYDKGKFFTAEDLLEKKTTDASGTATFVKLEYSVYSYLFKNNAIASVHAMNNCYETDVESFRFHSLSNNETIVVQMKPTMLKMDFLVVDKGDNEPLPNAKVSVTATVSGLTITDSATTGPDGTLLFQNLPKCGKVDRVYATAEGYYPDSIVGKASEYLLSGSIDSIRKLRLKPIKAPIVFYVIDCITKVGLADVDVDIDFTFDNKKPKSANTKTNINGVGKGIYDSAEVNAKLHLKGSKAYYKEGELPGIHKVRDFTDTMLYKRPQRTFCLDPEPNPILFKTIDSINKQPIPGVQNLVTVTKADGKEETKVIPSGKDGTFTASLSPGDKISIVSKYPPGYKDNNQTIKNEPVDKIRNWPEKPIPIPMAPVIVELKFRTVDAENGNLVPDADLNITGGVIDPGPVKSGITGEFIVKARLNSTLTIIASKPNFGINDYSIVNKSVEFLVKSTQVERDIPLKKEPPPVLPPPCSVKQSSGGEGLYEEDFDMGSDKVQFDVEFDLETIPDEVIIYCGSKGNLKSVIAETGGPASGIFIAHINMAECRGQWITIKVMGSSIGTQWKYKFVCP